MTKGRFRRTIGFVPVIPIVIILAAQMTFLAINFKLKQRKSKKYFRQGLVEAGLSEKEAKLVTKRWS